MYLKNIYHLFWCRKWLSWEESRGYKLGEDKNCAIITNKAWTFNVKLHFGLKLGSVLCKGYLVWELFDWFIQDNCHTRSNLGFSTVLDIYKSCKLDHKVAWLLIMHQEPPTYPLPWLVSDWWVCLGVQRGCLKISKNLSDN